LKQTCRDHEMINTLPIHFRPRVTLLAVVLSCLVGIGQTACNSAGGPPSDTTRKPESSSGLAQDPLPNEVKAVSAGRYFNLALKASGQLWSWGSNLAGQLGIGTTSDGAEPRSIPAGREVKAMSAGGFHALALRMDGYVLAWGNNTVGQLGDGTNDQRTTPVLVDLGNVKAVAAGLFHSLGLKSDGTVWAWGAGDDGQLGDGRRQMHNVPTRVPGLTDVTAIAAGDYHSLALKADGTVWAWGKNDVGQLGDGTAMRRDSPVGVLMRPGVKEIVAGASFSFALLARGRMYAWGSNDHGELGDNTHTSHRVPARVLLIHGTRDIAAGTFHGLAIQYTQNSPEADGTRGFGWGRNDLGQLGMESGADAPFPLPLDLFQVIQLAGGRCHTLALLSERPYVRAAGCNRHHQLGIGSEEPFLTTFSDLAFTED
jgi:alpha-tubulin suppressor-like RCC1 family protein